jgi:hypothetical protein
MTSLTDIPQGDGKGSDMELDDETPRRPSDVNDGADSEAASRGTPKMVPHNASPLRVLDFRPERPKTKIRKRKTLSDEERARTALVRRLGACEVCRLRKVQVCHPKSVTFIWIFR